MTGDREPGSIVEQVTGFLNRAALAEAERVEMLCAEAMTLQDFDKLERLVIVSQDHHATAIASRLEDWRT